LDYNFVNKNLINKLSNQVYYTVNSIFKIIQLYTP